MASPIHRRLVDLAGKIATAPPEDIAFSHSVFYQASLPAGRPPEDMLVWERRQGRAVLRVEAGSAIDPRTGQFEQLGLPYGPKARLLLMHLNSEAVRRQSPILPVEDSMTAFFRRLMGRTQDGRQVRMLKSHLIQPDPVLEASVSAIERGRGANLLSFYIWLMTDPPILNRSPR